VTSIEPDPASLRRLLQEFRDLPPKVRTRVRRDLRGVGDNIIAGQRAILDGPLPRGVAVVGKRISLTTNKRTGKLSMRTLNRYGDADVKRGGRSTGLRERIKASLVTRVVTGKSRQGIDIRTRNKQAPMATGWNSKRFRHPVFGDKKRWVYQSGQPYFFDPVYRGRDDMLRRAADILNSEMEGR